eukprot:gene2534-3137_t
MDNQTTTNTDSSSLTSTTTSEESNKITVDNTSECNNSSTSTSTTTTTTTTNTTNPENKIIINGVDVTHLSKNQRKKLIKNERWEQIKDQKKAYLKKKKKENKKKRKQQRTPEEKLHATEIKKKKKRDPSTIEYANDIIFDFELCDLMGDKEEKSLVTQMCFLYGVNRKAEKPFNLYITGFGGRIKPIFENMSGFSFWNMKCHTESYLDIFKKEDLVYLTSDSPNVITELDPKKKYIIGGLVDHNRLKGITYKKAQEQGIETAQLPIGNYIQMASRKILAVNHGKVC